MDRTGIINSVSAIIETVKSDGLEALIKYSQEFDGFSLSESNIEVSEEEKLKLADQVDPELSSVIKKAAFNIKRYSEHQMTTLTRNSIFDENGITVEDRLLAVESAAVYVPGGLYPYPSTVLMCAVPARIAGVKDVVMVTPPKNLTPVVAAAAQIAGVNRIFRVGGAQAIAALAYNIVLPHVDIIVGPGNSYVQYAKMLLSDIVGIDMIAGPSEVVIIADAYQDTDNIAADMLSQAEHSEDASSVLIALSDTILEEVKSKIPEEYSCRISFKKASDIKEAVNISNSIAPEHLELMLNGDLLEQGKSMIKNAGAVFVGPDTPVAFGDYWAGPSHTLPTGRASRYTEGLNVRTFLKNVSYIRSSEEAVSRDYMDIAALAESEGMKYHSASLKKRLKR